MVKIQEGTKQPPKEKRKDIEIKGTVTWHNEAYR